MDQDKFQRTVLAGLSSLAAQFGTALEGITALGQKVDALAQQPSGRSVMVVPNDGASWISRPTSIGTVRIRAFDMQPPAVLEKIFKLRDMANAQPGGQATGLPLGEFYVPLVLVTQVYPDLTEEQKMRIAMNAGATPGTDFNVGRWAYAFPNAPKSWEYGDHIPGIFCFNGKTENTQEAVLAALQKAIDLAMDQPLGNPEGVDFSPKK